MLTYVLIRYTHPNINNLFKVIHKCLPVNPQFSTIMKKIVNNNIMINENEYGWVSGTGPRLTARRESLRMALNSLLT